MTKRQILFIKAGNSFSRFSTGRELLYRQGSCFTGGGVTLQVEELLYRSGSCFTGGFKSVTVRKASVTKINHF
jgi:hypothetical protein